MVESTGSKYGEAASNSPLQATAKSTPRLRAKPFGVIESGMT
jgi:hypothetical protein